MTELEFKRGFVKAAVSRYSCPFTYTRVSAQRASTIFPIIQSAWGFTSNFVHYMPPYNR